VTDFSGSQYLLVTAFDFKDIKHMDLDEVLCVSGVYTGGIFVQDVPCPKCFLSMVVKFNQNEEPEYAQCVSCSYYTKVLFREDISISYLPWRSGYGEKYFRRDGGDKS